MPLLALCIGSNENAGENIRQALDRLQEKFGPLRCSNVYRSAAVGFDGPDFLNLVALTESDAPVAETVAWLKQLESSLGRDHDRSSYSSRPIDIDVFIPGDPDGANGKLTVSHRHLLENAFVLRPLAELLPKHKLEAKGLDLSRLWREFDKSSQPLRPVKLDSPDQGPKAVTGITTTPSRRR